jgi:hypothetical protein
MWRVECLETMLICTEDKRKGSFKCKVAREAEHSPPTNAEVKKMWICTSTPPYAFMV